MRSVCLEDLTGLALSGYTKNCGRYHDIVKHGCKIDVEQTGKVVLGTNAADSHMRRLGCPHVYVPLTIFFACIRLNTM